MKNTKLKAGMCNFLLWIFMLLFIISTNTLVYLSSLLNFNDSSQLIFVFSLYLLVYIVSLILLAWVWRFLHKFLAIKTLPGQKILVTYEVTFEEYEKIKVFLAEVRA
ncbi:hypothetical protein [Pseudomonas sp. H3(2019)]|uniref:hypothetical protein n=1 Tax=Pseudomonas sp. H3(2019) TaxID=2598724 RepID=UPI001194A8B5|nr:hypothetical protein [Pseudomonas sp. H3(2019)]TVT79594.1 hypothetical protein FPT12_26080 [Pseudomonas sp. H3(2019)]